MARIGDFVERLGKQPQPRNVRENRQRVIAALRVFLALVLALLVVPVGFITALLGMGGGLLGVPPLVAALWLIKGRRWYVFFILLPPLGAGATWVLWAVSQPSWE